MKTTIEILQQTYKNVETDYSDSCEKKEVLELINELHNKLKKYEIMENNKLIAQFMELPTEIFNSGNLNYYFKEFNSGTWYEEQELSYNISWDWLMPVVEKIRKVPSYDRDKFGTEVIIYNGKTSIKSGGYGEKEHSNSFFNKSVRGKYNSIEPTHKAVVEFIKWYNSNKNFK